MYVYLARSPNPRVATRWLGKASTVVHAQLYVRTRAERFCNGCGGFIRRAPRGQRNEALNRKARLALWLCARYTCSRSRSRAFWARRPAFASPRTFSP